MSGRLGDYLDLIADARRKRLEITRKQQKEIADIYRQSAKYFEREALKHGENTLTYRWLKDYAKSLRTGSKAMFEKLGSIAAQSIYGTAKAVTEMERRFYTSACPLLSERFRDVFSTIPQKAVDELMSGGIYKRFAGLSERIWDYQKKYMRDISVVINRGIIQQKSAYELSKDLEKYLNPNAAKPWNWSIVYPGVNRQVDYNAQRLARTAVTHAYQISFMRATHDNPFVEAYKWLSSNSSRTCPICAERDGKIYDKDSVPLDHPNGMCIIVAVISKSYEEIGAELGDWAAGENNPAIDRWLLPHTQ